MKVQWLVQKGLTRISNVSREELYFAMGVDKTKPERITCEVNERCNFKCKYCHYWQMPAYANEMSIEEWQKALSSLQSFLGHLTVQFIGGEPFLKKDFVELLEHCHKRGIEWGVITNASALNHHNVERVVNSRPINVDISVDSSIDAVNDDVRGAPGSLRRIERAVQRLRDAREAAGTKFVIRAITTITRQNFRQLPLMASWARQHGFDTVDFHPVHQLPTWSDAIRAELWPTVEEVAEMHGVVEQLVAQKASGLLIETADEKLRSIPAQFLGSIVPTAITGPCRAGMRTFTIKANGDVTSCWEFPVIGNVREAGARDVWTSEHAKVIRRKTVQCPKVGGECANSCLDHRSLKQDIVRGLKLLGGSQRIKS